MPQARPTPWQAPGLRVPRAGAGRRLLAAPAGCGGGPPATPLRSRRRSRPTLSGGAVDPDARAGYRGAPPQRGGAPRVPRQGAGRPGGVPAGTAVLAIAVIAALGPSLPHTLVAVGIVWWPWYARIVRGEVRAQAVRSHVDAARLAGVGRTRLALRHLLPGAFPAVLVTASLDVGSLVLILAGLSFIGLGSPPPAPELGAMAARGMPYLFGHPWIPLAPAIAVFLLAFAANLAGDGLRDLLEDH